MMNEATERKSVIADKLNDFCGSAFLTVILLISLAIPTAMVSIGAIYLYKCPVQRLIPIYLIVAGCFGIAQTLFSAIVRIRNQWLRQVERNANPNPVSGIVSIFLFAWLIAGCVWVYQSFGHVTTEIASSSNYCHPVLYWFAFSLITISLSMLLIVVFVLIILGFLVMLQR